MGIYFIEIKETAQKELQKIYKSGDSSTIIKLNKILLELSKHPTSGIGNPEKLKYNLTGYWSRRLNKKDRLVYKVIEEPDNLVVIVSALGHY